MDNFVDSKRSPSPSSRPATGFAGASSLLGKGKYKAWILAAIILFSLWSMLTDTTTLNFSSHHRHGLLLRTDDFIDAPLLEDLDILEVEEREKMVKQMWVVYLQNENERAKLQRFWQDVFEAAYEDMAGDDERPRDSAVSEIARMTFHIPNLDLPSTKKKNEEQEKMNDDNANNLARKFMAFKQ